MPSTGRYKIILASASPRRRALLSALDLPFVVRVKENIDESFPPTLAPEDIAEYICQKKSHAYTLAADELLITADTIVIIDGAVLGKPADAAAAKAMLARLAGRTHHVVTGCCVRTAAQTRHFSVTTAVTFGPLTAEEIDYYVGRYLPLDKAGAYGVQEWIGCVAVTAINGSYFNVMGLPVQRLYEVLKEMGAA